MVHQLRSQMNGGNGSVMPSPHPAQMLHPTIPLMNGHHPHHHPMMPPPLPAGMVPIAADPYHPAASAISSTGAPMAIVPSRPAPAPPPMVNGGQTLPVRRYSPDAVPENMKSDVNIPRILVIPRGPKGFGFILRGAKSKTFVVDIIFFYLRGILFSLSFFLGS